MQVRGSGEPGGADVPDDLALPNPRTDPDTPGKGTEVAVPGGDAVDVPDLYQIAVASGPSHRSDGPVAGRNFLKNAVYSAHFGTEGLTPGEARLKLASVRAIASKYGAEVANSIPTYFNANPFMEITPILGPNGELWKPTHGVLPFSAVLKHHAEFEALLAEFRDRMRQHRVQLTRMLMFFSTNCFIYEPTFLWEDERSIYHRRVYPAALLPGVPEHPANPQGRALVKELKGRIQELCSRNGASHLQVGKDYPYLASRKPETRALVLALKHLLDPDRLLNPGALGLPL